MPLKAERRDHCPTVCLLLPLLLFRATANTLSRSRQQAKVLFVRLYHLSVFVILAHQQVNLPISRETYLNAWEFLLVLTG